MAVINQLYRHSLALLTDLYQLTMGYGYWKSGMDARESVFQLTFRQNPFGGGFAIACGLESVLEALSAFQFSADDLGYLASLRGADDQRLFEPAFVDFLPDLRLVCDVDAIPEGTVVFPHEPLVRVRGPLLQAQLVETLLLNQINFQTLIATKAARVCLAAAGREVLDFGLRRAQGIDGGLTASRAAYVGGCGGTSNVLAGKLYGIPVRGTHAHSWVMSFDDELTAFEAYGRALPNNSAFLVDTYDTPRGIQNAVAVGRELHESGHRLLGIRLDSGDLAALSRQARDVLDRAGFSTAKIVASNDLDEHSITSLKEQGAAIDVWGVGTRLVTGYDQPALGGVYKLSAIRDAETGNWSPRIKLSQQAVKVSNPGMLQVRRYHDGRRLLGDVLFDQQRGLAADARAVSLADAAPWPLPQAKFEDLLQPMFRAGRRVCESPALAAVRDRTAKQLDLLPPEHKRLRGSGEYPLAMDRELHRLKQALIAVARGAGR